MGTETTLRADSDLLQRLLLSLASTLCHKLGRLVDPCLHLLLVLQLTKLGRDDANHDVAVFGQELKRLKATRALGVVLEVEGVDLQLGEKLLCDDVVRTFGKVATADEVAAAQVHTGMEIGGQLGDAVVVKRNVGVEERIDRADVVLVFGPALAELVGAEV